MHEEEGSEYSSSYYLNALKCFSFLAFFLSAGTLPLLDGFEKYAVYTKIFYVYPFCYMRYMACLACIVMALILLRYLFFAVRSTPAVIVRRNSVEIIAPIRKIIYFDDIVSVNGSFKNRIVIVKNDGTRGNIPAILLNDAQGVWAELNEYRTFR